MPPNSWVGHLRPHKIPFRRRFARASVALIFRKTEDGGKELLFIQRARREGDPWSGDMAFPGGRLQPEDASARAAAERETLEETGIDLSRHGSYQARLSDLITRHHSRWRPMVVTPYVFEWRGSKAVSPNHEVERVVWLPLDYLAARENQSQLPWRTPLGTLNLPCCRYQDACIWGLSYSMLQEVLELEHGVFALENPKEIALSLKKSAEDSTRRKSDPYQSAMSMLTFYINRAGKQLSAEQRNRLEKAKDELRALFGRAHKKQ